MKEKRFLIVGILILLGSLILSYLNYKVSQNRQMLIANHLYSTWSVNLIEEMEFDILIDSLPSNTRLFFEHIENPNVRTFYQNGDWTPPMISGDFFNIESARYIAVVGEYHVRNNEKTLEIGESIYEIIGVIGAEFPSTLDRLILLNVLPQNLPIETIVIDSRSPSEMTDIYQQFDVQNRHLEATAYEFLENQMLNESIQRNIVTVTILLSFLFGYIYVQITEKKTNVLHLLGMSKLMILLNQLSELTLYMLISFIIIFFLDFFVGQQLFFIYGHLYLSLFILILIGYLTNYFLNLFLKKGGIFNG